MKKKNKTKWNRVHIFLRKKSNKRRVGHPVYVFGQSGRDYKYLTFTHKPKEGHEDDYDDLKHNIDPNEDDRLTYVKKQSDISRITSFREPDKKYRIHKDDINKINKYKK